MIDEIQTYLVSIATYGKVDISPELLRLTTENIAGLQTRYDSIIIKRYIKV